MKQRIEVPADKVPAPGQRRVLYYENRILALFNVDGELYAVDDSCPHQGASLAGGRLDGRVIQCCAHGLRFDLTTGYMLNSNKVRVAQYSVEQTADGIYIHLTEAAAE